MPRYVQWCKEWKECKAIDPKKNIKIYNVMAKQFAEIINDLANGLTKESLGLMAVIVMVVMCFCGKCGISRGDSGKVKISVGDTQKE